MNYGVPLKWLVHGILPVEAKSLKEAVGYALSPDNPLPKEREFVPDSLELDLPALYALARVAFPDSDAAFFEELYQERERQMKEEKNA